MILPEPEGSHIPQSRRFRHLSSIAAHWALTAILGYADIMLEENVGRATWNHAEVIKRNGGHLLGLINDILDLSKVEAGKMQINPTYCSPLELRAEVMSLMRVRAEDGLDNQRLIGFLLKKAGAQVVVVEKGVVF